MEIWTTTRPAVRYGSSSMTLAVGLSILSLAGVLCAEAEAVGERIELYVAPAGDDKQSGSRASPLRTLEAARDRLRQLKKSLPQATGMTVWLAGGIYHRQQSFELTAEDSGTATAPVVYRAVEGTRARLTGGSLITHSSLVAVTDPDTLARLNPHIRDKVRQLDLKSVGDTHYEKGFLEGGLELFCGDQRMPQARWPNSGWARAIRRTPDDTQHFHFDCDDSPPGQWKQPGEVLLHGYWQADYRAIIVNASQILPDDREIHLSRPLGDGHTSARRFYAFNAIEEIDRPGEWYLDRRRGMLYVFPTHQFAEKPLIVSTLLQPLVTTRNTSYVTFRGLTFEAVRGQAVYILGGTSNHLMACTIRNTGSDAVWLHGGTNHRVVGCDIHNFGARGIRVMGGDRAMLRSSGIELVNNHIHDIAVLGRSERPAITLQGVGHRVAHNLIHDGPHYAIRYEGNDHVIELNEIHHMDLETSDAGVLYSGYDWTFRGNMVRHNFIHHIPSDIPHLTGAYTRVVYLDDGVCSTDTIGNVFYKTHQTIWIGGGRDNRIENNIFINCEQPVGMDNRGLRWSFLNPGGDLKDTGMFRKLSAVDYQNPPWSTRFPRLARILNEHPRAPLGNTLRSNVSISSGWRNPETWCRKTSPGHINNPYMQIENNFVTAEDPGFVDADNMNFQLRDDSIVYTEIPGFQRIPFENIGLYKDEYRASWPAAIKTIPSAEHP